MQWVQNPSQRGVDNLNNLNNLNILGKKRRNI